MKNALWILSCLAVALVTGVMQLDRQSRYTPALAEYVPETARYFAQTHIARTALQQNVTEQALKATQALVARRPVPAEHLQLLARAHLAAGNTEAGLQALQIAGRRGWRDRTTQESLAQLALAADDPAQAATRIAALYARQVDDGIHRVLAEPALSDPRGREAMAQLLANSARWSTAFLRQAPADLQRTNLNALLLNAHDKGAKLNCTHLRDIVKRQSREDRMPEAQSELAPLIERNCQD